MKDIIYKEALIDGVNFSFEKGRLAPQAHLSIFAKMGDTAILVTVIVSKPKETPGFFPLTIEYQEKLYASGIISSSRFIKREGRPSSNEILKARIIDRSIRPLFKEDFRSEVQVVVTVLSYDHENDPSVLSVNAVSLALLSLGLPFEGPVSGVKVALIDNEFVLNPKDSIVSESSLNMFISSTDDSISMIESDGDSIKEEKIISAIEFAYNNSKALRDLQREFLKSENIVPFEYDPYIIPQDLLDNIKKDFIQEIDKFVWEGNEDPSDKIIEKFNEEYSENIINDAISYLEKISCREGIIDKKKRPDGRGMDDIRDLYIDVDILPCTHGSALFQRGETQVLSVVTLASERQRQTIESIYGEESKKYMHHYNFPGWSVGELSRNLYYPSRRDIGHGALAEKALERQIPDIEEFPYAIRVVSETLSSNGSSSMASVCGSTLALMAAGVNIKNPISGIAMGLVMKDDKYEILTDIQGPEDHFGDMDFKVAGSKDGITALQMDNKLKGVPISILKEALAKANTARNFILAKMLEVIPEPRLSISKYAPKIEIMKIAQKDIGSVIGSGGKVIKEIIEKSGAEVFISDDGNVSITSDVEGAVDKAVSMIMDIVKEVEIGGIYTAKVVKITTFGIFVDITPSVSGLVHVSEMADKFIKDPGTLVKIGDEVLVKVIGKDEKGKLKFSMKQAKD